MAARKTPALKLTEAQVEAAARALYKKYTTGSAPSWDRIGEVTKNVWRERVKNGDK